MNLKSGALCLVPLLFSSQLHATNVGGKERAEKRVVSCYVSDLRGKSCSPEILKKDGESLLSLYKAGDKSVLASLMRVNALSVGVRSLDTQFFTQAMQDDLESSAPFQLAVIYSDPIGIDDSTVFFHPDRVSDLNTDVLRFGTYRMPTLKLY